MSSPAFTDRPYTATRREHTLAVPYERFTRGFESLLGVMKPDVLANVGSAAAARDRLEALVGPSGFVLFHKIDHGTLLTVFTGRATRATTFVFGNALIAIEMTRHVPEVGLYVPLRIYVRELSPERTVATYDRPSAILGQFGSDDVHRVAEMLDAKVEALITRAAQTAATLTTLSAS